MGALVKSSDGKSLMLIEALYHHPETAVFGAQAQEFWVLATLGNRRSLKSIPAAAPNV